MFEGYVDIVIIEDLDFFVYGCREVNFEFLCSLLRFVKN